MATLDGDVKERTLLWGLGQTVFWGRLQTCFNFWGSLKLRTQKKLN